MDIQVIFGLSVSAVLCILGLFFGKNKALYRLMMIWLLLLLCFNTGGSDWTSNYRIYLDASFRSISLINILSFGYTTICAFAKQFGISYEILQLILGGIASIIIFRVILKYATKPATVMSFMMLYPFVDNIIQKRWYYAMGIIIAGLPILWEEKNKKRRWIKFCIICFISAQFHTAALFFAAILLFEFIPEKHRWKVMLVAFIIEMFAVSYLPRILLNMAMFESKANLYLITYAENSTIIKFAFWTVWHLAIVLLSLHIGHLRVNIFNRKTKKDFTVRTKDNKEAEYSFERTMLILNYFSLLIIPFYIFDPVFTRMFRPIVILDYIMICNHITSNKSNYSKTGMRNLLLGFAMSVSSFIIFYIITGAGFDQLVIPLLENNLFLKLLF